MYYQQHDGVVSDTNSPLSLRSYPASCPVSPATSPTPLSSRSFQQLLNPHTVASSSQVSNIVSFPTISGDQVAFQTQRQFRAANKVPLQLPSAPPYPGTSEVVSFYQFPVPPPYWHSSSSIFRRDKHYLVKCVLYCQCGWSKAPLYKLIGFIVGHFILLSTLSKSYWLHRFKPFFCKFLIFYFPPFISLFSSLYYDHELYYNLVNC